MTHENEKRSRNRTLSAIGGFTAIEVSTALQKASSSSDQASILPVLVGDVVAALALWFF